MIGLKSLNFKYYTNFSATSIFPSPHPSSEATFSSSCHEGDDDRIGKRKKWPWRRGEEVEEEEEGNSGSGGGGED